MTGDKYEVIKEKVFLDKNTDSILTTDEVVKYILANYNSIFEKELQALVFCSEVSWTVNKSQDSSFSKLSNTEFCRTPNAIYSERVRSYLEELDLPSRRAYDNGYKTTKYDCRSISFSVDTDSEEYINGINTIQNVIDQLDHKEKNDVMNMISSWNIVQSTDIGYYISLEPLK